MFILFLFLVPIFITLIGIVAGTLAYYEIHVFKCYKYFSRLRESSINILKDSFPYYEKLKEDEKIIFNKRVQHFLINKKFVSTDIEITEEMRVLIAATAMQILAGLEPYYLSYFQTIHITIKENIAAPSPKVKNIYISWPAFEAGIRSSSDGYNPGLKILAMAFNLEHQLVRYSARMFNKHRFKELNKIYRSEAEKYIASGKSKYNDYKQVDRNEYFAVAVEYFFERPEHFYANQPKMYLALSRLLRQDPLGYFNYKKNIH